jgi:hypothetical protein
MNSEISELPLVILTHIAYIQIFNTVFKMKRLIVFIKILLFSSVGFGCPSAILLSNNHEKPAYEFVAQKQSTDGRYVYPIMPQKIKTILNDSTAIISFSHKSGQL